MRQRHAAIRLSDGTLIYDVFGADSGDEQEEELDDSELDSDEDDESEDEDNSESVEELKAKLAAAQLAASRAERRMRNADRAKSKEVQKRQQIENAGKSELQLAQEELETLRQELAQKRIDENSIVMREAFRDLDGYEWHDRKLAFSELDLSEVEVDEKGNVDEDALKEAVEALAKNRPFLLKTSAKSNEEEDEERPSSSGQKFNGAKQRNSSNDRVVLEKRYPQLANRK